MPHRARDTNLRMVGTPPAAHSRGRRLCPPYGLTHRVPLHRELSLEVIEIAVDRGDREHAATAPVLQETIPSRDIAVDRDLVPLFGVADIVDWHVVMLAPEKRHGVERLARAQHVSRGGLALALGHHPVLDPD